MGRLLEINAEKYPTNPMIKYEDRVLSYGELNLLVNKYADYLSRCNVSKGKRVAVLMENRPEMIMIVLALNKLGAVSVLINTKQRRQVLLHSFNIAKPYAYIIGEECITAFQQVDQDVPSGAFFYLPETQSISIPDGFVDLDQRSKYCNGLNPETTRQNVLADPCFLIYTSGTTGLPKASIMSNQRYIKACYGFGQIALNLTTSDVIYVTLPLYHNNALTIGLGSALLTGASIALRRKFSASRFWSDCQRYQVTCFVYIGELCRYLLNQPEQSAIDRSHLVRKMIGNGLRHEIWGEFKTRFGIEQVYELYAASEANIGFCNFFNFDNTVGLCPYPFAIVKVNVSTGEPIRDKNRHLIKVKRGDVGLLLGQVNTHAPYDGYINKEASESKLLRNCFETNDLWFNTGDLMKNVGFWHAEFVDRLGDTFRWKGENVSTTQVEGVLNRVNGIAESVVYGVSVDGHEGRCGMAFVVLKTQVDLVELLQYLQKHLAAYAIPRFIRVGRQVSLTGTFKHQKADLKKEGYDLKQIHQDQVFVLIDNEYIPMTNDLHRFT